MTNYCSPTSSRYSFKNDLEPHNTISQNVFGECIRAVDNPFTFQFLATLNKGALCRTDRLYRYPPLEYAILVGDEESLRYLLNLKSSSDYFSDSLVFFYIDCLKEDQSPNLEILKLLLDRMTDINTRLYSKRQEVKVNVLDFAFFHMASFKDLPIAVIEELFRRGAKSSVKAGYSAFERIKDAFPSTTCIFKIVKYESTHDSINKAYDRLCCTRIYLRLKGRAMLTVPTIKPKRYTLAFSESFDGRFVSKSGRALQLNSLLKQRIPGVCTNPTLKHLYHYHRVEKKYDPDSSHYLTVEEFDEHLAGIRSLCNSIKKIFSSYAQLNFSPSLDEVELKKFSYNAAFWEKRRAHPLMICLVDKEKISLTPFEMNFLTKYPFDHSKVEYPTLVCNSEDGYFIGLQRTLFLLHKSMHEHVNYFNELVNEGKFEDCFSQREIEDLTDVLAAIMRRFPVTQQEMYAELGQEIRQTSFASLRAKGL